MLMIDILKSDGDIIRFKHDHNVEYEYVNLLAYCKAVYEVTVTDLAKLLNVERQTIYNYYKHSTSKLSPKVVGMLLNIYKLNTLNEIIDFEKNNLLNGYKDANNSHTYDIIKQSFHDTIRFSSILEKISSDRNLILKFEQLMQVHHTDFLIEVFDYLMDKPKNSISFLTYLRKYNITYQNDNYEVIDKIINSNGLIKLDLKDFMPLENICKIYSVTVDKIQNIDNIPKMIDKVVINICSGSNLNIQFIQDVLECVKIKFGQNIPITYGCTVEKNKSETIIDIITYTKLKVGKTWIIS